MRVKVCVGARCTMMGASAVLDALEDLQNRYFRDGGLDIVQVNCMNVCKEKGVQYTPVVEIDGEVFTTVKPHEISGVILERAGIQAK